MPDVFDTIESAMRTLQERLSVSTVYGEPVSANGVTVVPVSKVQFGFVGGGSGAGTKPGGDGETEAEAGSGSGGGMGGGQVEPVGFIEITDAGARWVPLEPPRGEVALRALVTLAAIAPFGGRGRGGLLRRLLLLGLGQAVVGGLFRRRLGQLPEGLRFGRRAIQEPE